MDDQPLLDLIFRAIARNTPAKQPAAVMEALRENHVIITKEQWERVKDAAGPEWNWNPDYFGKSGDLDP